MTQKDRIINFFLKTICAGIALATMPVVAAADTVTYQLDLRIADENQYNSTRIDLNNDGLMDVEFGFFSSNIPFVETLQSAVDPFGPFPQLMSYSVQLVEPEAVLTQASVTSFFTDAVTGDVMLFAEGDAVGAGVNAGFDDYNNNISAPLSAGGYMGFKIETGQVEMSPYSEGTWSGGFVGETVTTFAFVNITEGSIILGQAGYNTTNGAAAVIPGMTPAVPLPASFLLLGGALGGMGVLRRKARR
ncbi:MAG: VPLPA-CTERM sorting domain-containing protein [Pseudomonadota bacterium]|nr:VPLPA-CTERM sorting domain-containing protein [Pseudomonadota bacterium]